MDDLNDVSTMKGSGCPTTSSGGDRSPTTPPFLTLRSGRTLFPRSDYRQTIVKHVPLRQILNVVCQTFGVDERKIASRRRLQAYADARHVLYWLASKLSIESFASLGRAFNRDHATIMYGVHKIDGMIADGRPLGNEALRLKEILEARL